MTVARVVREAADWDESLAALPETSRDVYFTHGYHALHAGEGEPECWSVRRSAGCLVVPGLRTAIPDALDAEACDLQSCNGYAGPLAGPGLPPEELELAWQDWRQEAARQGVVAAFFRLHPLLRNERWLAGDARVVLDRHTVFLDLSVGVDALWRGAAGRHRNMVRAGRRAGTRVEWRQDAWQDFAALYEGAMARAGAPERLRFGRRYFEALARLPGAELAVATDPRGLAAGAAFVSGSVWCHYHLAARRSDAPNHLSNSLLQAAIERAAERGLLGLHLGGGRTAAPDDSLLAFKRTVGGRLLDFRVARVVVDPVRFARLEDRWRERIGRPPTWLLGYRQPAAHVNGRA